MVETSPVVAAALVVLGAVGAVPVAALSGTDIGAQQTAANGTATDETAADESLAPGERFAGVVGVEQAEIEGELAARAFGQRVAAAATNESAAGVVAAEVDALDERLAELDAELRELERAHENGTMSDGEYRARLARLHAEQRALQRQINQTGSVARQLPAAALEARGVDVTAIETLRSQASELTGPEVAAVARDIAGENAGKGMGGPPERAGPSAFGENRTGGPPVDAGPGNETGQAGDGAAGDGGAVNEAGQSGDAGAGNETSRTGDDAAGNETGQAGDGGDAGTGGSTAGDDGSGDGANDGGGGDADEGASRSIATAGDWQ